MSISSVSKQCYLEQSMDKSFQVFGLHHFRNHPSYFQQDQRNIICLFLRNEISDSLVSTMQGRGGYQEKKVTFGTLENRMATRKCGSAQLPRSVASQKAARVSWRQLRQLICLMIELSEWKERETAIRVSPGIRIYMYIHTERRISFHLLFYLPWWTWTGLLVGYSVIYRVWFDAAVARRDKCTRRTGSLSC